MHYTLAFLEKPNVNISCMPGATQLPSIEDNTAPIPHPPCPSRAAEALEPDTG